MNDYETIIVSAEAGESIRINVTRFYETSLQVLLFTESAFHAFENASGDPGVARPTEMTTLTPTAPSHVFLVPSSNNWHIVCHRLCGQITASKAANQ